MVRVRVRVRAVPELVDLRQALEGALLLVGDALLLRLLVLLCG